MLSPSRDVWYQSFRLQFVLPSSGKFSNVSTRISDSIFRNFFKFTFYNVFNKFIHLNLKFSLKMEAKILVETFEIFPEDRSTNVGRKLQYQKLPIDGVSVYFVGLQFQDISRDGATSQYTKSPTDGADIHFCGKICIHSAKIFFGACFKGWE